MSDFSHRRPIAVTMGDPAGVGPEVAARAWAARREHGLPPFVAIGDIAAIDAVWDGPVARVGDMEEAVRTFAEALPVWNLEDSGPRTEESSVGKECVSAGRSRRLSSDYTTTNIRLRVYISGELTCPHTHAINHHRL